MIRWERERRKKEGKGGGKKKGEKKREGGFLREGAPTKVIVHSEGRGRGAREVRAAG